MSPRYSFFVDLGGVWEEHIVVLAAELSPCCGTRRSTVLQYLQTLNSNCRDELRWHSSWLSWWPRRPDHFQMNPDHIVRRLNTAKPDDN